MAQKLLYHFRATVALPCVHGLAVFHRLPDALHPGKTIKRQRREFILSRAVFCFHYARGRDECVIGRCNVPIKYERTILNIRTVNNQEQKTKSGRPMAAPTVLLCATKRISGDYPTISVSHVAREKSVDLLRNAQNKVCSTVPKHRGEGCRGNAPAAGGTGDEQSPAPVRCGMLNKREGQAPPLRQTDC